MTFGRRGKSDRIIDGGYGTWDCTSTREREKWRRAPSPRAAGIRTSVFSVVCLARAEIEETRREAPVALVGTRPNLYLSQL